MAEERPGVGMHAAAPVSAAKFDITELEYATSFLVRRERADTDRRILRWIALGISAIVLGPCLAAGLAIAIWLTITP